MARELWLFCEGSQFTPRCQRMLKTTSNQLHGWLISGETATCPSCRKEFVFTNQPDDMTSKNVVRAYRR